MEYNVDVNISLKPGVLDAEGETVEKSLKLLDYKTTKVNTVKGYKITIEAKSESEAKKIIEDACEKLLANPVIQNYRVKVK